MSVLAVLLSVMTVSGPAGGQTLGLTCEEAVDAPAVVRLVGSEVFVSSPRPSEQDLLSCSVTPRTVGLPTLIRMYVRRDPDRQGEWQALRKRYDGRLRLVYDIGEQGFYFYQDMAYPDRVGSSVGRPSREWGLAVHGGGVTIVVSGVPELGAREMDAKAYLAERVQALLAIVHGLPPR